MTDMCILMTAAVCHDLDHPGYNNTYVTDTSTLSENNKPTTDNTACVISLPMTSWMCGGIYDVSIIYTIGTDEGFALCNQVSD